MLLGFDEVFEFLEAIDPHRFEVLGERAERGAVGAVEVLAAAFVQENESGFAQNAKVLRHCSEGDISVRCYFAGWPFFIPDQLEDLLSAWFGENGEGIDHDIILVYTKI